MLVALIQNDIVVNIIEIESVPHALSLLPQYEAVDASMYPNINVGSIRNGEDWDPPPPEPVNTDAIEAEKFRRFEQGFTFQSNTYQARQIDIGNFNGATLAAFLAVSLEGKTAGDLRWADPNKDFFWVTKDNESVPLDAPTMIVLGKTAMAYVSHITTRARYLKDEVLTGTVYEDITIDALWV